MSRITAAIDLAIVTMSRQVWGLKSNSRILINLGRRFELRVFIYFFLLPAFARAVPLKENLDRNDGLPS